MHNLKGNRILGIVKISLVHNRDTPHHLAHSCEELNGKKIKRI